MPVLFVNGMPKAICSKVEDIIPLLLEAVASVKGLDITKDDVTIFLPQDMIQKGLGEEITVFVEGLFDNEKRTPAVRQELASVIAQTIGNFVKGVEESWPVKCKKIEVFVKKFDSSKDGFTVIEL